MQTVPLFSARSLYGGSTITDVLQQLRSSRSTRNQDHLVASRNRPGVVDLDPTEGLPVQKWEQIAVRVNQDPSNEAPAVTNLPQGSTSTSSAEWAAQFGTPQFPWQEKPLPSFFNQLPSWNQEMLRRARAGNTNAKTSVWERKTNSWISAAEAEKRQNPLKSVHLNNVDPNSGSKQNTAPDSPAQDDDEDHDEKSDEELDGEHADDEVGHSAAVKRRKKYTPEERIFEVKRWVQMPSAIADKTEERKFLADRRPGMPSLYGGPYQNQVFGSMGLNTNGYGFSAANAGYDLGEGGGLDNAGGMLQSNEGVATPVRKNMPPKRKKKKGGPGRKKANPDPIAQTDANGGQVSATNEVGEDGTATSQLAGDVTMAEGDNEGSDSGSEAEGSEEGEIEEGVRDTEKQNGHIESHDDAPMNAEVTQIISSIQDSQNAVTAQPQPIIMDSKDAETGEPMSDMNANEEEQVVPAAIDATHEDVTMQDQSVPAASPAIQPEPEIIPSIIQPPVSEQLPELTAPEPTVPMEVTGNVPVAALPIQELIQETEPVSVEQITQPIESQLQPIPQTIPQPVEPEIIEQPTLPVTSEQEATTEVLSTAVPSLEPVPVDPETQLPPISTIIAEAIDQPSTSAPGAAPPVEPVTEPISTTAPAPTLEIPPTSEIESATVPQPTAQPPTQTGSVPEPTSPDLLGGLEDELDKNMGEENNE